MKYLLLTGLYLIWGLVWGCSQSPKSTTSGTSSAPLSQAQSHPTDPLQNSTATLYPLQVKTHDIQVELACTFAEQSQGLMFRKQLEKNHGMLFIFSRPQILSFWMKNTLIPLDIAYINSAGRIIDIQSMEPETLVSHPSKSEAQYALEMNQGWFAEQNVGVGPSIVVPECPAAEEN